ncbi:ATP-binding cassette domain-containing protein [Patescibacteria group bacterium]|nr:ATP-binding cassette domain-containing protein [Patescibacteria group bacterium]
MPTPRPLLSIHNLHKTYGRQVVLEDISCTISEGQKIALIGRNGAGKSTLLNILMGLEERDSGEIETLPWTQLGLVAQHEILPSDISCEEYCEKKSGKPSWETRKLAARFGLTLAHLAKKPSELSGGYQMRLKIVAMLLQDPTLLLLDEPVNYLDLQTLLLLEQFLADYNGSFVVTAHDREFLQNICNATFEIERGELTTFPGGVEEYLEYKDEQREFLRRTNKKLAKEIAHQQAFVDRFRFKASQASRAQSKIKHIAKLRTQVSAVKSDLATTRITIPTPHFIAGTALRCDKLTIGYGDKVIGDNITFEVIRGEKVVIAGENGQGKSTLLKTIAGRIPELSGQAKWWHKADIGYYDQKTDATLLPDETVLSYLTRMAPLQAPGERILMMAGNFLFRNDDLEKRTNVLSGGERARLCLAGILLHEHSVLLLDEPTNHLDVETAEALALALKEYGGTVIFISHARTFVNALADRIYEVRNGTLKHYTGSYEEYVADVAQRNHAEQRVDVASQNTASEEELRARQEARLVAKERRKTLDRLQAQIATLEKEKSELLAYFFENPTDYAPEKSRRLTELTEEIGRLEEQWLRMVS